MARTKRYTPNSKMAELISDHYSMLLLIFRFDIPLGMGEKTIKEVCEEYNVEVDTFLIILHFLLFGEGKRNGDLYHRLSIPLLIKFLRNSHSYFLEFRLPAIREDLLNSISGAPEEIIFVIEKYFEEYEQEVHQHMMYENEVVFPYVQDLIQGKKQPEYSIDIFEQRHDKVELKMLELKNIFIKYYTMEPNYKVNNMLHELFSCGDELRDHNDVEDYLFIPCVRRLEEDLAQKEAKSTK